jgi:3-oxoadipate enol-lactonase
MKIKANGINIHYALAGPASAPVITLSHSLAADLSMWDPQMKVLTEKYRVLRYDMRGHGGTDVPEGHYSLEELTADVHALLVALGIEQTHFIGLSIGGMIAQLFAIQHPAMIRSLILCDTSSELPQEAKALFEERIRTAKTSGMGFHVEPTLERWFTKAFRFTPAADRIRTLIRKTDPQGYIGCSYAIMGLNLTGRLSSIHLPTLIIVGEDDPGTPVAAARTIHEKIKDSELVILRSASHLSNIEQAEPFNKAVISFLARANAL